MNIINDFPPNYEKIKAAFNLSPEDKIVFTYGEVIYNPTGGMIDKALEAHEESHSVFQKLMGKEKWWKLYLEDTNFRLGEEVKAYRIQYKMVKNHVKDRNKVFNFLAKIANDLSGPMYGNCISFEEALRLIKS